MTDRRDQLLSDIQREIIDNRQATEELQWESGRVQFLLTRGNLGAYKRSLLALNHSDPPRLTFAAFTDRFPSFPVVFGVSRLDGVRLHMDAKATWPAVFRSFQHYPVTPVYRDFYEATKHLVGGRCVALVFPRKGIQQGLVAHDGGMEEYTPPDTTLLSCVRRAQNDPEEIVIQTFASLVTGIFASGLWHPED